MVTGILSQRSHMDAPYFPAIMCDSMCEMLSTSEAQLSYSVQSFGGVCHIRQALLQMRSLSNPDLLSQPFPTQ